MFNRIYCHIPFCIKKCSYCAFFSVQFDAEAMETYCNSLCRHISMSAALYQCKPIDSIYFGGGTPSLLTFQQLSKILSSISAHYPLANNTEITLEANPGTVTRQTLSDFRSCGVNRLSLGVQSFHNKHLKNLGRIHTVEQSLETIDSARRVGFDNLGIDLIHGLQNQSLTDWKQELEYAVDLGSEHLSIYGLTIEEETPFALRYGGKEEELPDDELSADMYELAHEFLSQSGYEHYEIANYAVPGHASRHNSGYWMRDGYLGIGAGAHSFLAQGYGVRFSNVADIKKYQQVIDENKLPQKDYVQLKKEDAMEEFMFLGLRLSGGISFKSFAQQFGCEIMDMYTNEIKRLDDAKLLNVSNEGIKLSLKGMLLSNQVFACFIK